MIPGTLAQAETLAHEIDDPGLVVVDCRFDLTRPALGREQYLAGHLPGAVHADLDLDLSAPRTATSGRHPLPDPEIFAGRLRAWGVSGESRVVAYDAGNGMYAARLWWMLRWVGHDTVAVLDGGFRRWQALGLPVDARLQTPSIGNFVAQLRPEMIADAAAVRAAAGDPAARVLDARAAERYRGDVEPIDAVAGHVPGARNHPFALSLDPEDRFHAPAVLGGSFAASLDGVPPGQTIAMCGSGVTACHVLLALEHAGLHGARLYAGSWSEWSRDPSRPVRTGSLP